MLAQRTAEGGRQSLEVNGVHGLHLRRTTPSVDVQTHCRDSFFNQ